MSHLTGSYETVIADHQVIIEKRAGEDYYIEVRAPNGCYCYDGFWAGSADKTIEEAIAEAKAGALIGDG